LPGGAAAPVAEVRKGHHPLATDAQHFLEDPVRVVHDLQRMGHHHHVEALVREIRQALVEILLDDAEAAADGVGDVVRIDLDTGHIGATLLAQQSQELTIATAEVEHPGSGGDPAQDMGEVLAHQVITRCR
jgi:hypothetical protein